MARKYTPDDILRLVARRRWLILLPLALGVASVGPIGTMAPKRYRSEALLMVVPQRVPDDYVKATVTKDVRERLPTITEQILSRARLERIVDELKLYERDRKGQLMEDVIAAMRLDIMMPRVIGERERADSFRIGFVHEQPKVAQKVAQRLASLYVDQNLLDRANQSESTSQFLDAQLDGAKRRLIEHEKKLEEYRRRYDGQLPTQLQGNLQAIQSAQMQLQAVLETSNRARERRLMIERLLADAKMYPVASPGSGAPGPRKATPAEELADARTRLADMRLRFTARHPDIVDMERVIATLEQEAADPPAPPLDSAAVATLTPAELAHKRRIGELEAELEVNARQLAASEAEEARLKQVAAGYQAKVDVVPTRESELVELTRDYSTLQAAYSNMLLKREDSNVATDLERGKIGEQFQIIDTASLPERPFNEQKRMGMMAAGPIAGLVLGVGLLLLMELRDSSFKREEDVMRVLSLPVLALVPRMASDVERSAHRRRTMLMDAAGITLVLVAAASLAWWRVQL